jgi:hypothetical protein
LIRFLPLGAGLTPRGVCPHAFQATTRFGW